MRCFRLALCRAPLRKSNVCQEKADPVFPDLSADDPSPDLHQDRLRPLLIHELVNSALFK